MFFFFTGRGSLHVQQERFDIEPNAPKFRTPLENKPKPKKIRKEETAPVTKYIAPKPQGVLAPTPQPTVPPPPPAVKPAAAPAPAVWRRAEPRPGARAIEAAPLAAPKKAPPVGNRRQYPGAAPSFLGPENASEFHFETPSQRPACRHSLHNEYLGQAIDKLLRSSRLERRAEDAAYEASVAEAWLTRPDERPARQPHLNSPRLGMRPPLSAHASPSTARASTPSTGMPATPQAGRSPAASRAEARSESRDAPASAEPTLSRVHPWLPMHVPMVASGRSGPSESRAARVGNRGAPGRSHGRSAASKLRPTPSSMPAPAQLPARLQAGLPPSPQSQEAGLQSQVQSSAQKPPPPTKTQSQPDDPAPPTAVALRSSTAAQAVAVCAEFGEGDADLAAAAISRLAKLCAAARADPGKGRARLAAADEQAEEALQGLGGLFGVSKEPRRAQDQARGREPTPSDGPGGAPDSGFGALLSLMRCHPHSAAVQAAGSMLLIQLMTSEARKQEAAAAGAVALVLDVIRSSDSEAPATAAAAAAATATTAAATAAAMAAAAPAGVATVAIAAQASACLALVSLTSSSSERTALCLEQGALSAVIRALHAHPRAPLLQLNGLMALHHLLRDVEGSSADESRCQAAAEAGALEAAAAALSDARAEWPTVTWAALVLLQMTGGSALRTHSALEIGGRAALTKALKKAVGKAAGNRTNLPTSHAMVVSPVAERARGGETAAQGGAGVRSGGDRSHVAASAALVRGVPVAAPAHAPQSLASLIRLAREWLDLHAQMLTSAKTRANETPPTPPPARATGPGPKRDALAETAACDGVYIRSSFAAPPRPGPPAGGRYGRSSLWALLQAWVQPAIDYVEARWAAARAAADARAAEEADEAEIACALSCEQMADESAAFHQRKSLLAAISLQAVERGRRARRDSAERARASSSHIQPASPPPDARASSCPRLDTAAVAAYEDAGGGAVSVAEEARGAASDHLIQPPPLTTFYVPLPPPGPEDFLTRQRWLWTDAGVAPAVAPAMAAVRRVQAAQRGHQDRKALAERRATLVTQEQMIRPSGCTD